MNKPILNSEINLTNKNNAIRLPPSNIDAEQAIIGCILIDNSKYITAIDYIKSSNYMYKPSHEKIWSAIQTMFAKKELIDTITLINYLRNNNVLDEVGGAYYITGMSNEAPSVENIKYYCNIVRDKYLQRQVILASVQLNNFAYDDAEKTKNYLTRMKITCEQLLAMQPGDSYSMADITDDAIDSISKGENIVFFDNPVVSGIVRGITRGGIAAIGARTGNGKTTLSTFIMKEYIKQNPDNVGIMFNLLMLTTEIIKKLIAMESNISYTRIREAKNISDFTDPEQVEIKRVQEILKTQYKNLHMFENIRTLDKIMFQINKLHPDLVIIDYIQLVRIDGVKIVREVMAKVMEDIEWESKPKNSNFATIMVSQLNREIKDRFDPKPTLTDFKESGAIEEGCETAIMPFYGHSFDAVRYPEKQMYEVMIRKNRFGLPSNYAVCWDGEKQNFYKPSVVQLDTFKQISKKNERKSSATL